MRLGILADKDVSDDDLRQKLNTLNDILSLSEIVFDKSISRQLNAWCFVKNVKGCLIDSPDWIQEIQSGESKLSDILSECDGILAIFSSETALTTFLTERIVREALMVKKGVMAFIFNVGNTPEIQETSKERFLRSLKDAKNNRE